VWHLRNCASSFCCMLNSTHTTDPAPSVDWARTTCLLITNFPPASPTTCCPQK
jgi:hypothetical protein